VTFSLLAPCTYQLKHMKTKRMLSLVIEPRTVVVLAGEARKQWKHGIPTAKQLAIRQRRLSITFRTIKPGRVRPS
jgi:alkylated DNA repair dioxygenase AlkB